MTSKEKKYARLCLLVGAFVTSNCAIAAGPPGENSPELPPIMEFQPFSYVDGQAGVAELYSKGTYSSLDVHSSTAFASVRNPVGAGTVAQEMSVREALTHYYGGSMQAVYQAETQMNDAFRSGEKFVMGPDLTAPGANMHSGICLEVGCVSGRMDDWNFNSPRPGQPPSTPTPPPPPPPPREVTCSEATTAAVEWKVTQQARETMCKWTKLGSRSGVGKCIGATVLEGAAAVVAAHKAKECATPTPPTRPPGQGSTMWGWW